MKRLLLLITICISTVSFGQTNNYSLEFDGNDDYHVVNLNQELEFTIMTMVKINSFDPQGFDLIFQHKNDCTRGGGYLVGHQNGQLRLLIENCGECSPASCPSSHNITNILQLNLNEFYHVALTSDGVDKITLFINGVEVAIVTNTNAVVGYGIQPLTIGKWQSGSTLSYSNSIHDDLAYWNIALDSIQIQQYMNCPPTGNETGLVGYWNFEEGTGTTTTDQTSNGNDGTLTNGPTWSTDVPPYNCCTPDPITSQPTDVTVPLNGTGMFSTTTSITSPTYQWQMDNGTGYMDLTNAGQFSGVDTDMLTVSNVTLGQNNTLFRCIVTENSNCSDTTDVAVLTVEDNTGLYDLNKNIFNVYPNPTSNSFTISSDNLINSEFKIIDSQGREVLTGTMNGQEHTIDISKLSNGVYSVVFNNTEYPVVSVIKE